MRARAASLLVVASVCASTLLTACNDDGRTLRDPRPDQVASVSTTTVTTIDPLVPIDSSQVLPVPSLPIGSGDLPVPVVPDTGDIPLVDLVQAPWPNEGAIPARYTCDDLDVSPALQWPASPTGTVEIAVTLVDQDAPDFVHWVMTGIDPFATSLGEGEIPEFATVGVNSDGEAGYAGPCPLPGETHRYIYTVHFLDQVSELGDGAAGADLQVFVNGATFESLSVVGTYSRG